MSVLSKETLRKLCMFIDVSNLLIFILSAISIKVYCSAVWAFFFLVKF